MTAVRGGGGGGSSQLGFHDSMHLFFFSISVTHRFRQQQLHEQHSHRSALDFFFVQPSTLWFDCRCFCSVFVSIFTPKVAVYWLLILFSSCSARLAFLGEFYGEKLRVFNFQSQEALDLHSYCLATTWPGLPRDIFNLWWEMQWFFLKIKIGLIFFFNSSTIYPILNHPFVLILV